MALTAPLERLGYLRQFDLLETFDGQPATCLVVLLTRREHLLRAEGVTLLSRLPTIWIVADRAECSDVFTAAVDVRCTGILLGHECGLDAWRGVMRRVDQQSAHGMTLSRVAEFADPRLLSLIEGSVLGRRVVVPHLVAQHSQLSIRQLDALFAAHGFSGSADGLRWIRALLAADLLDMAPALIGDRSVAWLGSPDALRKLITRLAPQPRRSSLVGAHVHMALLARLAAR